VTPLGPTAQALLAHWALAWDRRGLPWRADASLVRKTLVEGLLAQTTAAIVAEHYTRILGDVEHPNDWLDLPLSEQRARVAPLGLPRLKQAALDSLASAFRLRRLRPTRLTRRDVAGLADRPGVGPYTAGMIALLHGYEAAPVDCNVQRVGARADAEGNAATWIASVLGEVCAVPETSIDRPLGYYAISAVLDVGATVCAPVMPDCLRCPLLDCCASAPKLARQQIMPW